MKHFIFSAILLLNTFILAQDAGIYQSYVVIERSSQEYFDCLPNYSANTSFNGADLGDFSQGETLTLKGGEVKTWKNGGANVTGTKMAYRIYKNGTTPTGSFSEIEFSWKSNNEDGDVNNQKWDEISQSIDLLNGLTTAGDYVLEIYFTANTSVGDKYSNNGGANYKANFTFTDTILNGIVTVSPGYPNRTEPITITLDTSGTALAGEATVYLHSGVGMEEPGATGFGNTVGNWGADDGIGEMTNIGTDLWEITLTSIDDYYNLIQNDDAFALNFLFRSANGSLKEDNGGNNYHLDINAGEYFLLETPDYSPYLVEINTAFNVTATSNVSADWTLLETDELGAILSTINTQSTITNYTFSHSINDLNLHYFKLIADYGGGITKEKTFQVKPYETVLTETMPAGAKQGANYNLPNTGEVTFVLHTPTSTTFDFNDCGGGTFTSTTAEKNIIYLIGDFNNWGISEDYKLKKDGDYWWITLTPSTDFSSPLQDEYVYQYLIDGTIRIGDPYGHKVSDPDDQYISNDTYLGLINYPSGQTTGRATVLQLNPTEYTWQVPNFNRTLTGNNLNIYELHFRDFTEEGTYKAATGKLDYIADMGINCIHVMPVSEFEGNDSWGYNPNYYFALDKAYGTPNDLKEFIDEAHKRGIAVVNDMVLNHAFYSNPNAMMYWNNELNRPADDNPWFNPEHKAVYDSAGHWGADFNHSSNHTKAMVDDILDYWITEYKFDGFRFDFTKGFTQTDPDPGDPWASSYDNCRVAILKRMVNTMWANHPNTYAIFEHLAEDAEDKALADHGILMWSGAGPQEDWIKMAEGNEKRSFWSSVHESRGFTYANYMSYMESHDEERIGYQVNNYGVNNDNSMQYFSNRLKLVAAFNLFIPGPRMVWQFGELGYDVSINTNGRTGQKPSAWELSYDTDTERQEIYNLYSHIFKFRNEYNLYNTIDYRNIGSTTDWNRTLSLYDSGSGTHVIAVGNFDPYNGQTVNPGYANTGTWYKYNGDPTVDGTPYEVSNTGDGYYLYINDPVYLLSNADIIPPVFNVESSTIQTDYCQYTIPDTTYDITMGIWLAGTTDLGKVADNSGTVTLNLLEINGETATVSTLQNWKPKTGENVILWEAADASGNKTQLEKIITLERGECYKEGSTGTPLNSDVLMSTLNRGNHLTTTKQNGALVLESKEKGLVITKIPVGETIEGNISVAEKGMLIYDENDNCLKLFDGTNWGCIQQKALPVNP